MQEVVSALKELGEFKNAVTEIKIRLGKPENPAGKVLFPMGLELMAVTKSRKRTSNMASEQLYIFT